jgi:flagellar biosynthesis protein FliP
VIFKDNFPASRWGLLSPIIRNMEALPSYLTGIVAILLLTSFIKVFTSLNILRYGIGLSGGSFGVVILGLALALTFVVMTPQIEGAGGLNALLSTPNSSPLIEKSFRPFLEKHTHPDIRSRFVEIGKKVTAAKAAPADSNAGQIPEAATSFSVLIASFIVSELKEAFQLGLLLLLPFVVIDLVVANVVTAVGINQLPLYVVSLPLKLLLFFSVDGWTLVSEKILNSYL